MRTITCYFYGGPWDGQVHALTEAPYRLIVPVLGEVVWNVRDPEASVKYEEKRYVRRGPEKGGVVEYDLEE